MYPLLMTLATPVGAAVNVVIISSAGLTEDVPDDPVAVIVILYVVFDVKPVNVIGLVDPVAVTMVPLSCAVA